MNCFLRGLTIWCLGTHNWFPIEKIIRLQGHRNLWDITLGVSRFLTKKSKILTRYKKDNTEIYQQFTYLSHISFVLSWITAFLCDAIELRLFVCSQCPYCLRSVQWSSLSHVLDDTIQVNSIEKTNVTVVISEALPLAQSGFLEGCNL